MSGLDKQVDRQIEVLYSQLESLLRKNSCDQTVSNATRERVTKAIKNNLHHTTVTEVHYSQSLTALLQTSQHPEALKWKLSELQHSNVTFVKEFVKLLHDIHEDSALVALFHRAGESPHLQRALQPVSSKGSQHGSVPGTNPAYAYTTPHKVHSGSQISGASAFHTPEVPLKPGAGYKDPSGKAGSALYQSNPMYLQAGGDAMRQASNGAALTAPAAGNLFQRVPLADMPYDAALRMPSWNYDRPFLTAMHLVENIQDLNSMEPITMQDLLGSLPLPVQKVTIIHDLLSCFVGMEGKYIKAKMVEGELGPVPEFSVQGDLDKCLKDRVQQLLGICQSVVVVQRFVETRSAYSWGLVNHALAAAMREMIEDWELMVAQLEHQHLLGRLTLQALLFYTERPMAALQLLASVAAEAAYAGKGLTSAGLLNLLHNKRQEFMGDAMKEGILQRLLQMACRPYLKQLQGWLCHGLLHDPYNEFMVQEDKTVTKDQLQDNELAYWSSRYTLRVRDAAAAVAAASASPGTRLDRALLDVPGFLMQHRDKILTTGKYLNVIRECGRKCASPLAADQTLQYDPGHRYLHLIDVCHSAASKALLQLIREDYQLLTWLRSVKHFFLLDQGDLMVHLFESAHEELNKKAQEISASRLHSLLELAMKTSSLAFDPYSDNLSFTMDPRALMECVRDAFPSMPFSWAGSAQKQKIGQQQNRPAEKLGWDLFMVSVNVTWPLTLLVSKHQLTLYQLIFKHAFGLKHAERELCTAWHSLQKAVCLNRSQRSGLTMAHRLCQHLLFFIQEFLRYMMFDVLEPNWHSMEDDIRKAANLDEVLKYHKDFLNKAMSGTLLSRGPLLRRVTTIEQLAHSFCGTIQRGWSPHQNPAPEMTEIRPGVARLARQQARQQHMAVQARDPELLSEVQKVAEVFEQQLEELVEGLQSHHDQLQQHEDSSWRTGTEVRSMRDIQDTREELDSLRNLIDRINVNNKGGAGTGLDF